MASTGTGSAGSAPSSASSQLMSRPATRAASCAGRWRMMQRSTETAASSIARSRSGLYSTMRFGSSPHDADTTTDARESSMREASSGAANPPNTTEWIAPSRAQASIVMIASGTMGM